MNDIAELRQFACASRPERRQAIFELQALLEKSQSQPVECPLDHEFSDGQYARTILLPQGSLVVGKIHKHAHTNVISQGRCTVLTEWGIETITAPAVFVSPIGCKRVVLSHEDTIWTTVHVTDSTDLEEIEREVIAETYSGVAIDAEFKEIADDLA